MLDASFIRQLLFPWRLAVTIEWMQETQALKDLSWRREPWRELPDKNCYQWWGESRNLWPKTSQKTLLKSSFEHLLKLNRRTKKKQPQNPGLQAT